MAQPSRPSRLPLRVLVLSALVIPMHLAMGCRVEEHPTEDPPQGEQAPPREEPAPEGAGGVGAEPSPPVFAVGDAFWAGEGTRAAELRATFLSQEALGAYLDRSQPVARTEDGRQWFLSDILVSVEFPGAGERAIWRVAGPEEVITRYLEAFRELESAREESPVRDLGILHLEARHCCAEVPSQRRPPQEESDGGG
jgi:hypothetical protein